MLRSLNTTRSATAGFFTTGLLTGLFTAGLLTGCGVTSHTERPSERGVPASAEALEAAAEQAGPIRFETVIAADWQVDRKGLINLDHPKARAAGLENGKEPIFIAFHVIRHPEHGLFIIDTGVEAAWRTEAGSDKVSGLVKSFMDTDALKVRVDTAEWLAAQPEPLAGVFLTHLHLDHVMGLPDIPKDVPIYGGPHETEHEGFEMMFVQGTMDALLEGFGPMRAWPFEARAEGAFEGVVDVFGDASVFALHVPGHTEGSTAFLIRSTEGPVLVLGDASHTAWGWQNGVEPGGFSYDQPRSVGSLKRLKSFADRHPGLKVLPGHQHLPSRSIEQAAALN